MRKEEENIKKPFGYDRKLTQKVLEHELKTSQGFQELVRRKGGIRQFNSSVEGGVINSVMSELKERITENLKSALQGLLEEIKILEENSRVREIQNEEFELGYQDALDDVRDLIKKCFPIVEEREGEA